MEVFVRNHLHVNMQDYGQVDFNNKNNTCYIKQTSN